MLFFAHLFPPIINPSISIRYISSPLYIIFPYIVASSFISSFPIINNFISSPSLFNFNISSPLYIIGSSILLLNSSIPLSTYSTKFNNISGNITANRCNFPPCNIKLLLLNLTQFFFYNFFPLLPI